MCDSNERHAGDVHHKLYLLILNILSLLLEHKNKHSTHTTIIAVRNPCLNIFHPQ